MGIHGKEEKLVETVVESPVVVRQFECQATVVVRHVECQTTEPFLSHLTSVEIISTLTHDQATGYP